MTRAIKCRPQVGWLRDLPHDRLLGEFSLWSADLTRLADEVRRVDPYADLYHLDVADGHFSPQLLFFPDLVAQVRTLTAKPLHVHLMAADSIVLAQIDLFADAGADLISVHAENAEVAACLERIAECGLEAGLVLQLGTPVEAAVPFLGRIGLLTLLGTRMGVKGQSLAAEAEARLREARALLDRRGRHTLLSADGAIRETTVPRLGAAGADAVVLGSLAFGAANLSERMAWVGAQGARGQ